MPNIKLVAAHCKFTNLHCETFDKQALEFKKCYIKAVSRDYNYITIFINLKEVVRKVKVRVSLLKRANGWKPFLYDINVDGCQFIRNPARNPVANLFYQFLKEFSNINHACPYDHDVLIDKLTILNGTVKLPFPLGEYALDTQWVINNRMLLRVNGSCIYWKE
ncbi:uncharacterized protein LOC119673991 [Teleopsis dalmanni]|uniref:uncharacterized protein LOC119673991 n=1 Tax=Teleopsis dalmanni TaxID=139649 RepID=UPI0018CE2EC9|nr:uncharacterized protein LOC119673991 [Teleopsis dalmanni]